MYYGNIKYNDIANGIGVRTTLFVSGCTNRCKNCFQPETWAFDYGQPFTDEVMQKILDSVEPYYVNGITILGGEPFEPANQGTILELMQAFRDRYQFDKDIWIFSGCTLEELMDPDSSHHCEFTDDILRLADVLVDGRFVEELKDITLKFRGSSNQRVIDLNRTGATGQIELLLE